MPLVNGRTTAINAVKQAMLDQNGNTDEDQTPDAAATALATKIVDALIALVKTGLVTTTGSAAAQTGSMN